MDGVFIEMDEAMKKEVLPLFYFGKAAAEGDFKSFIIFMLSFVSAGDAARVLAEKKYEHPSPEQVEEVRHEEGLDQPVLVQYGKWLDQALHGDFGKSYSTKKPATDELKKYFPQTLNWQLLRFYC